ncbi:pilus assembly protein TadG-related protein [Ruegeria sp. HU-ET01832]|uniref:Tad domain-containing protein n=1 Tax=Ruegeria sp. HU-ET01832 TaxID=3135906 RepID=UPI003103E569
MFSVKEFKKEEDGAILVFVGMSLVFIFGFVALTFDLGRVVSTQTDLQSYADHVALAAAGELDGEGDAITRAEAAAAAMIADEQFFAEGDRALASAADFDIRFLTGLPNDARDEASVASFVTTDPTLAVMAEVTATPRTVFLPFSRALATLLGATPQDAEVSAQAIAGFTAYACDVTPLMFCIPPGWTANANIGSTIKLRTGQANAEWGPGNFGFLDPTDFGINPEGPCAGLNGSNLYICLIAAEGNKGRCVVQRGVDTEPGQRQGIGGAIYNSRFDYFTSTLSNKRNDPAYAPGPQVISGWTQSAGNGNGNGNGGGNSCISGQPTASLDTMPFPPDDCFATDTCGSLVPNSGGRFGNGDWSNGRQDYLDVNYGAGLDPLNNPLPVNNSDGANVIRNMPTGLPSAGGTTRYQMYLEEINQFSGGPILSNRSETGRAQCATPASTDPDRRTFILAAIDCAANNVQGRALDVPVEEYVKGFMIQPLANSSGTDFDIYLEVVEQVGGAGLGGSEDDGIFRDVVRLYR